MDRAPTEEQWMKGTQGIILADGISQSGKYECYRPQSLLSFVNVNSDVSMQSLYVKDSDAHNPLSISVVLAGP